MKEIKESNKYDVITEDTLKKELTESEIDALRQRAKDNKFHETIEQVYADEIFNHEHHNCMRLPDGRHRFGTIGGGISTIITMQHNKVTSIKLRCHTCDTVTDITEGLPLPEDAEERAKLEKKYPHYADFGMTWVEYARYEKFCEDYIQGEYDNATPANPAPAFLLFIGDLRPLYCFKESRIHVLPVVC